MTSKTSTSPSSTQRADRIVRTKCLWSVSAGVNARKSCSPGSSAAASCSAATSIGFGCHQLRSRLERRRDPAAPDPVAVAARARRVARVEIRRRLLGGDDDQVARAVPRSAPRAHARQAGRRRRRRSRRWRARARPCPCARRPARPSHEGKYASSAPSQRLLDRAQAGLRGPAAEGGAVIRDRQSQAHVREP